MTVTLPTWNAETAAQLTDLCLATFTTGLRHADRLTLQHEAERVEAMRPSPLVVRMRAAVDAERARRAAARNHGGMRHGGLDQVATRLAHATTTDPPIYRELAAAAGSEPRCERRPGDE